MKGHVGFDGIPDQLVNQATQKGFQFNILVVGHTACGKSSLLNTLFKTKFDGKPTAHTRDYVKIDKGYYCKLHIFYGSYTHTYTHTYMRSYTHSCTVVEQMNRKTIPVFNISH